MKKLLLIAALATMSMPALASKARLNSLGRSAHLVDTQTVFTNPAHNNLMADYVTFELGSTATVAAAPTASALAEGGFVRSAGDAKYMVYLGRKSDFTHLARLSSGFLTQENPIEFQYAMKGDINWGVGFNYSSSDKKSISQKQQAMGIRLGATTDVWDAYGVIGLGATATGNTAVSATKLADPDATYKGTAGFEFGGAYKVENLYIFGKYGQDGYKYESTVNAAITGQETTANTTEVGVVDHNKIEGGQWFYGASYKLSNSERKGAAIPATVADSKTETQTLPFLVGIEYDMASWVTLRASATQNVLISSKKTTPPGDADTVDNSTTVAAGVGFRLEKFVIDAAMQAATTGDLDMGDGTAGNKFLTNVAFTYNF